MPSRRRPAEVGEHRGQRAHAGVAVGRLRRARRGSAETPVGLRTKSIAAGMPCAARMPASCPAPVASSGAPGRTLRTRASSFGSKRVGGVHDSSVDVAPSSAASATIAATVRRTAASSAPRASSQAVTWLAMALTPPGSTRTWPTVARVPCSAGVHPSGGDDRREREHGVEAVLEPGRARVVGLARDVEAPAAVRPDRRAHADGAGWVVEVLLAVRDRPPGPGPARRAARRSNRPGPVPPHPGRGRPGHARPPARPATG